jgi:hypothetical protein
MAKTMQFSFGEDGEVETKTVSTQVYTRKDREVQEVPLTENEITTFIRHVAEEAGLDVSTYSPEELEAIVGYGGQDA